MVKSIVSFLLFIGISDSTLADTLPKLRTCTLSPIEQFESHGYTSNFGRAVAFKVPKKAATLSFSLVPQKANVILIPETQFTHGFGTEYINGGGQEKIVGYSYEVNSDPAQEVIRVEFYELGVTMVTNFQRISFAWGEEGIDSQSIKYHLPNDQVAIAALACIASDLELYSLPE